MNDLVKELQSVNRKLSLVLDVMVETDEEMRREQRLRKEHVAEIHRASRRLNKAIEASMEEQRVYMDDFRKNMKLMIEGLNRPEGSN